MSKPTTQICTQSLARLLHDLGDSAGASLRWHLEADRLLDDAAKAAETTANLLMVSVTSAQKGSPSAKVVIAASMPSGDTSTIEGHLSEVKTSRPSRVGAYGATFGGFGLSDDELARRDAAESEGTQE